MQMLVFLVRAPLSGLGEGLVLTLVQAPFSGQRAVLQPLEVPFEKRTDI